MIIFVKEFSLLEYPDVGARLFDTLMFALNALAVSLDTRIASVIFIFINTSMFHDSGW